MKTIAMVVAAVVMIGCSFAPVATPAHWQTGNSHGQYFPTQKEVVPPQLHKSSSHGGEY